MASFYIEDLRRQLLAVRNSVTDIDRNLKEYQAAKMLYNRAALALEFTTVIEEIDFPRDPRRLPDGRPIPIPPFPRTRTWYPFRPIELFLIP